MFTEIPYIAVKTSLMCLSEVSPVKFWILSVERVMPFSPFSVGYVPEPGCFFCQVKVWLGRFD